jgi:hypothetical protein
MKWAAVLSLQLSRHFRRTVRIRGLETFLTKDTKTQSNKKTLCLGVCVVNRCVASGSAEGRSFAARRGEPQRLLWLNTWGSLPRLYACACSAGQSRLFVQSPANHQIKSLFGQRSRRAKIIRRTHFVLVRGLSVYSSPRFEPKVLNGNASPGISARKFIVPENFEAAVCMRPPLSLLKL